MRLTTKPEYLVLLILLAGCTGCGRSGLDETVPIRGRVLYQGQPLSEGEIRYVPVDERNGRVARAKLDAGGNFQLTTLQHGDGALPGEYRVLVLAYVPGSGGDRGRERELLKSNDPYAQPYEPVARIPVQYTRPQLTPLADVVNAAHPGYREYALQAEAQASAARDP